VYGQLSGVVNDAAVYGTAVTVKKNNVSLAPDIFLD
jgi:hypothetical protein